jgi:hypothetical protein
MPCKRYWDSLKKGDTIDGYCPLLKGQLCLHLTVEYFPTLEGRLYEPWQLHAIMKNAILYIGDGATMATESALLGVPSIYISPLAGTMGNHIDLEHYRLMYSLKELPNERLLETIFSTPHSLWKSHQKNMLKDKIDTTEFMIEYFEGVE